MYFSKLHLVNFFSHRDTIVTFPITGLMGITGENMDDDSALSNGSGKSTIIDALVWCLYGNVIRNKGTGEGVGVSNDDVIRIGEKECSVVVDFCIGERTYTVERKRLKNRSILRLGVTRDGNYSELTKTKITDTQIEIDNLLNISFKSFLNLIFGQGVISKFMAFTDAERKQWLELLLNITWVKQLKENASAKRKDITSKLDALNTRLLVIESELKNSDIVLESLKETLGNLNLAYLKGKLITLRNDLLTTKSEMSIVDEESIGKLNKEKEKLLGSIENTKKLFNNKINNLIKKHNDINNKININEHKIYELQNKIDSITHQQATSTNCPFCGSDLKGESVGKYVNDLDQDISKCGEHRNKLRDDCAKYEDTYKQLEKARDSKIEELNLSILELDNKISMLTVKKNANNVLMEKAKHIQANINELEHNIVDIARKEKIIIERIESKAKEIGRIKNEAKHKIKEKALLEEELKYVLFWIQASGSNGIKQYLFDSVIGEMNERLRYYINVFAPGYTIEIDVVGDDMRVNAQAPNGGNMYAVMSGGEKQRVDLAVALCCQDIATKSLDIDFRVYDEPFNGLDEYGRDRLIQLLQKEARTKLMLLITHDVSRQTCMDSVIHVKKINGVSSIGEVAQ